MNSPIHQHSLSDWDHTLAVTLTGTFLMTRQALPALCDSGRGVVVNFTSTSAQVAHPYMAAYAAGKGGILSFTHGLALEYAAQGLGAENRAGRPNRGRAHRPETSTGRAAQSNSGQRVAGVWSAPAAQLGG